MVKEQDKQFGARRADQININEVVDFGRQNELGDLADMEGFVDQFFAK